MRFLRAACQWAALVSFCIPSSFAQGFDFLSVKKWRGTIQVAGTGEGQSGTTSWKLEHGAHAEVTLDHWDPDIRAWVGTVTGRGSVREEYTITAPQCTSVTTKIGEGDLTNDMFGQPRRFFMTVDDDQYRIYPNDPYVPTRNSSTICGTPFLTIDAAELWYPATRHAIGGKFPSQGTSLSGTIRYSAPGADPLGDIKWEITYSFTPIDTEELEVAIDPQQYGAWVPEGTKDELTAGNHITVKAQLRAKDGSTPKLKARKFTFSLTPSREPGVAMNFPLLKNDPRPPAPDLAFTVEQNPKLVVDLEGLKAETDEGEILEATAVISAFDFGGWADLTVTAQLEDGRTLTGKYNNESLLRLPKRPASSVIADSWKEQTGASGDDAEDKDNLPEGDGAAGDGLTLYEEYRGFFENGKHLRTDTRKKDLFVLDLIGAKTKPGIELFAGVTGLEVHHHLTDTELKVFPDPHVINSNHAKGPHIVDQHGVVIVETDKVKEGALAWSEKYSDVIGTPKTVDLIGVSTTPGEGLGAGSVAYFDKMIAHELLHAVNVPHHGDNDYSVSLNLKRTPSGKFVLHNIGTGNLYRLYEEESDIEISQALGEGMQQAAEAAGEAEFFRKQVESDGGFHLGNLIAGASGGQHSGHELCLMRYEFAKVYEIKNRSDAFYFFTGQQRGAILCERAEGTGANDEGHKPQPRHGKAANGGCRGRIRVNDLAQ